MSWGEKYGRKTVCFCFVHDRYILNYLRNGELLCSAELPSAIKKPLLGEARFYQVQSLVDELSPFPRVFNMSTIIRTRDQENALLTWLADEPQLMDAKWTVLFRASRDGWEPEEFHARCDGMSPTLTVVRSRSNAIFGGYTEEEWSSRKYARKTFDLLKSWTESSLL